MEPLQQVELQEHMALGEQAEQGRQDEHAVLTVSVEERLPLDDLRLRL